MALLNIYGIFYFNIYSNAFLNNDKIHFHNIFKYAKTFLLALSYKYVFFFKNYTFKYVAVMMASMHVDRVSPFKDGSNLIA